MKKNSMQNSMAGLVCILMSSCVIQSSQLNGFLELIERPHNDLLENQWILNFSGYESLVYAVSIDDEILFANSVGDWVVFDGWKVKQFSGINRNVSKIEIQGVYGDRVFKQGARTLAVHSCQPWERLARGALVKFSQSCKDIRNYVNSIIVQRDGTISVIRQIVDEKYSALTLTKLK